MDSQNEITIGRNAEGNIIVSGNNNQIEIIQRGTNKTDFEEASEAEKTDIGPNPYKGLEAFHEQDKDRFFGREELAEKLRKVYHALFESDIRFLPIIGPSGSGKSSVARAGLIPELVRNPLPAMKQARVAPFVPETKPLEALATILARIATNDDVPVSKAREFAHEMTLKNQDEQFDGLRRIAHALPDIARSPLVILVDQFEEIYSLCDDAEERRIFIENLIYAAKDRAARIFVVITLRSDFLGQTQTHPELSRIIAEKGVIIPAMNETELRRAITEPAQNAKSPINPAVADLLIEQAKDHEGVLPLLEFALTQIWEGMKKGVDSIKTLTEIRGVGGALANKAQEIYAALGEKEKRIAKRAFLAMIRLGEGTKDTRRRVPICEMVAYDETPEMVHQVLLKFSTAGSRLVTLNDGFAEITHEALFDHWLMLKEWLSKSRDDIRFERKLSEAANAWNESGKAAGLLWWQSPNLDLLEKFYQKNQSEFTVPQMAFYRASVRKDRMTKLINRGIAAVLVIFLMASVWGEIKANREKDRALKQKELAMQAISSLTYEFVDELAKLPRTQPILEKILKSNTDLLEKIYELNPDTPQAQREKSVNLHLMADNWLNIGNLEKSLQSYQQGNEILKKLVENEPKNMQGQRDLSVSYTRMGDIQLRLGNTDAAIKAYQQALEIFKKLAADDPKNTQVQNDLAISYGFIGDMQLQLGNLKAALEAYEQYHKIIRRLSQNDPKDTELQRYLSISYNKMGDIQLKLGNTDTAIKAYQQSLEIFKKLVFNDPKNTQAIRDLGISYSRIGNVQLRLEKTDEALVSYQEYLKITQKLAQDDPKNASAQRGLMWGNRKMGDVQSAMKNPKAALQYYQQALSIAETLAAKDKLNKQAQDDLAALKRLVEKMNQD